MAAYPDKRLRISSIIQEFIVNIRLQWYIINNYLITYYVSRCGEIELILHDRSFRTNCDIQVTRHSCSQTEVAESLGVPGDCPQDHSNVSEINEFISCLQYQTIHH